MNVKKLTDEQLVSMFVETQKNIYFEQLYDRYSDKVYRKCMSFVQDTAKAEDFTHDIFMKLVLNLSSYKETAKFSTWLFSITYNFCIDQVRIGKRSKETALDENYDVGFDDNDADLEEIEASKLNQALTNLTVEEKSILLMKYQDDLTIKEISSTLNISESAVKMRLLRSKDRLKKFYLESIVMWGVILAKFIGNHFFD